MKKLFLFLILSLFLTNSVFAIVTENNYVKYGTIDNSGNLITTNTNINDVNFRGYYCSSSNCASVYNAWFGPLNTLTNYIQLTYPTTLYSSFGYGIYVYKIGYIPWEAQSDYAGTGQASDYNNYLTKMQLCTSNINTLTLTNDSSKIYVNANIKSPINNAGPLNYVPNEIKEQYTVDVDVSLEVKKDGTNYYIDSKKINIDFSGNKNIDFSFSPSGNGNYEIKITTSKGDEKCIGETLVEKTGSIIINNPILNTYYKDLDNDNYSDGTTQTASSKPSGYKLISELISTAIDCNDNNAGINPGAIDICGNGIDEDCSGADAVCPTCTNGATQSCGSSNVGACSFGIQTCSAGTWGSCIGNIEPTTEICNGIDDNCNGQVDEGGICGTNDTFPPIVNLLSPINNQIFYGVSYLINFIFTVNDASDINNCYVAVSGTQNINQTNQTTITKLPNNNTINTTLLQGNYTAQVFCKDVFNNSGNSSQINFSITQCSMDSQCDSYDYFNNYCSGKDLYTNFTDFSCVSGSCVQTNFSQTFITCSYQCSNNQCKDKPDVKNKKKSSTCINDTENDLTFYDGNTGNYSLLDTQVLGAQSKSSENNNLIYWIIFIGLGILLLILLIIFYVARD